MVRLRHAQGCAVWRCCWIYRWRCCGLRDGIQASGQRHTLRGGLDELRLHTLDHVDHSMWLCHAHAMGMDVVV